MQLFYSLNLSSANWARVNERIRGHLTVRALVSPLSVRQSSGDDLKHGAELMPNNRETSVELWETRRSFYSETSELLPNLELSVWQPLRSQQRLSNSLQDEGTAETLNLETRQQSGIFKKQESKKGSEFKHQIITLNKRVKHSRDSLISVKHETFQTWAA